MRRTRCRARRRRGGRSGSKYWRAPSPGGQPGGVGALPVLPGAGGTWLGVSCQHHPCGAANSAVLDLLALSSWAAFPHCLCYPGRIFKGKEKLETQGMSFAFNLGVLVGWVFFPPTQPNLFWVLSSPYALKTHGVCGPASSAGTSCSTHPEPVAESITQVLHGLGWSEPAGARCFSDRVILWSVWREILACYVWEVSVYQLKWLEMPLLALSWKVAFDGNGAKGPLDEGFHQIVQGLVGVKEIWKSSRQFCLAAVRLLDVFGVIAFCIYCGFSPATNGFVFNLSGQVPLNQGKLETLMNL